MRLHIAYIAGFLDADGTVTATLVQQKSSLNYRSTMLAQVEFSNQDLQVLMDIQETLGCGRINAYRSGWSGCYRLHVPTSDVVRVLNSLLPYLRVKTQQAELLLRALDTRSRGSHKISEEALELRRSIVTEIQALNKRNGKAYRTKWVNSVNTSSSVTYVEAIPSQAVEGEGSTEGVTTRQVSPNNNPAHERPPRKGRDSLTTTVM